VWSSLANGSSRERVSTVDLDYFDPDRGQVAGGTGPVGIGPLNRAPGHMSERPHPSDQLVTARDLGHKVRRIDHLAASIDRGCHAQSLGCAQRQ